MKNRRKRGGINRSQIELYNLYGGGETEAAGLTYLKENGHLLYDFTAQSGGEGDSITAPTDLTGNGNDGVLGIHNVVTPKVRLKTLGAFSYKSCSIVGDDKSSLLMPCADFIEQDHELWITMRIDGFVGGGDTDRYIVGIFDDSGANIIRYYPTVNSSHPIYTYYSDGATSNFSAHRFSSLPFDPSEDQGQMVLRIINDYSKGTQTLNLNGISYTVAHQTGKLGLEDLDPLLYSGQVYIGLGKIYNPNSEDIEFIGTTDDEFNYFRIGFTPLITNQEDVNNVYEYMSLPELP